MLATVGDLVNDIVVRLSGPVNLASDTEARIDQRRGGSAANVAATAAGLGSPTRFIGQVGDDPVGTALIDELRSWGIDVSCIRRAGPTGTIVVLVDGAGERTMLTDRRTSLDLADPDPAWLAAVTVLHVPLYSLVRGSLARTSEVLIGWARERGVAVSVDASSAAIIRDFGARRVCELLARLEPAVLFANEDEARVLGLPVPGPLLTIVKQGPSPAVVISRSGTEADLEVPAVRIDRVRDSTGAGDAFAAGFLVFGGPPEPGSGPGWLDDPVGAVQAGHEAAAALISTR